MNNGRGMFWRVIAGIIVIVLFLAYPAVSLVLIVVFLILACLGSSETSKNHASDSRVEQRANQSTPTYQKTMLPDDYVVIDTETTGLDSATDRIIEIGAVRVRSRQVVDRFSALVNPARALTPYIIASTGITDEMLASQYDISRVLPDFFRWLGNDPVVGHNIKFDISFLSAEAKRVGVRYYVATCFDTMEISRSLFPAERHHRLEDLIRRFGIADVEEHRALSDALQTYQCLEWMRVYASSKSAKSPAPQSDGQIHRVRQDHFRKRARKQYMESHDCFPCNVRPEGNLIARIEECEGVDVSRRGDHQELFASFGQGAWMWVVVTRSYVDKGKYVGCPTIEVWLDGESAGYLTPLQASRHYLHVPEKGVVTQAHIRQDRVSGRYWMRVELPPAHQQIDLHPYLRLSDKVDSVTSTFPPYPPCQS